MKLRVSLEIFIYRHLKSFTYFDCACLGLSHFCFCFQFIFDKACYLIYINLLRFCFFFFFFQFLRLIVLNIMICRLLISLNLALKMNPFMSQLARLPPPPPSWFPLLPPDPPNSSAFWNNRNVHNQLRELQDTLNLAEAMYVVLISA